MCRRQFKEAFEAINAGFKEAFVSLFGGGHGELRLLEGAEETDAGVEIVAQPPGKKLQNVLLLSGGEKALTALALLIALFRYKPSPFCVLDEVDAPLDEANVDRFAQMVREMSATDSVHRHHAQQAYNGNRVASVRRHDGRARNIQNCFVRLNETRQSAVS